MSELVVAFALLQYGSVRVYESARHESDGAVLPSGELHPPLEHWAHLLPRCRTLEEVLEVMRHARSEVDTWKVRPEPPPEGETLDELQARILSFAGWEPKDVAFACRCTPTLVRRTRVEFERNAETGREEGSLTHARDLLSQGLSLRQVAILTGIPRSTLHRQLRVVSGTPGQ